MLRGLSQKDHSTVRIWHHIITVAMTLAMVLPVGGLRECCCASEQSGCCLFESVAQLQVQEKTCCNCSQTHAGQDAVCERDLQKNVGTRERSSCECCRQSKQDSTTLPVSRRHPVAVGASWCDVPTLASLPSVSVTYDDVPLPGLSHKKRRALLCVWIH